MISIIAAIGKNNELGYKNKLPWRLPEDLKHFKQYTLGKCVIMGRNTFMSIGRELPDRKNIIVSRTLSDPSLTIASTLEIALIMAMSYKDIVVIGGASIYRQAILYADKLLITKIDAEFEADTFFPFIDPLVWKEKNTFESKSEEYNYRQIEFVRNF